MRQRWRKTYRNYSRYNPDNEHQFYQFGGVPYAGKKEWRGFTDENPRWTGRDPYMEDKNAEQAEYKAIFRELDEAEERERISAEKDRVRRRAEAVRAVEEQLATKRAEKERQRREKRMNLVAEARKKLDERETQRMESVRILDERLDRERAERYGERQRRRMETLQERRKPDVVDTETVDDSRDTGRHVKKREIKVKEQPSVRTFEKERRLDEGRERQKSFMNAEKERERQRIEAEKERERVAAERYGERQRRRVDALREREMKRMTRQGRKFDGYPSLGVFEKERRFEEGKERQRNYKGVLKGRERIAAKNERQRFSAERQWRGIGKEVATKAVELGKERERRRIEAENERQRVLAEQERERVGRIRESARRAVESSARYKNQLTPKRRGFLNEGYKDAPRQKEIMIERESRRMLSLDAKRREREPKYFYTGKMNLDGEKFTNATQNKK